MRGHMPALAAVLLLAGGCTPPITPPAPEYHLVERLPPLTLAFAPRSTRLTPADLARLRAIRPVLPVQAMPELYASGPLAALRARAVRDALGRPILVHPVAAPTSPEAARPDEALLVLPTAEGSILSDACRGVGEPSAGDIWPGDDARRVQLLPPGCATAASIQAQVAAPSDLLLGRPLPPGASIPFADAIERYYRRNEPGQARSEGASAGRSQLGSSPGPGLPPASANPGNAVNPLLGPLTTDPAAVPPAQ